MPKSYYRCVDSEVATGKSLKEAKRICAISFYKKTNKALPHDSRSGLEADQIPTNLEEHPMDSSNAAVVLSSLYDILKAEGKLDNMDEDAENFFKYIKVK